MRILAMIFGISIMTCVCAIDDSGDDDADTGTEHCVDQPESDEE